MSKNYVMCLTPHGSYYFRRTDAPDRFNGQPIGEPDTLRNVMADLFKRLGLALTEGIKP